MVNFASWRNKENKHDHAIMAKKQLTTKQTENTVQIHDIKTTDQRQDKRQESSNKTKL